MEDDDNVSEDGLEWNLGFLEDVKPATLLRHRFPSKVGGRPAWLDPLHLPSPSQLSCGASGKPLQFLLQVYAPVEVEADDSFHRSIFLFVSPQGDQLSQPGAVKAFRSQLPRINPFYGYHPAEEQDTLPPPLPSLSSHPRDSSSCHSQNEAGQVRGPDTPVTSSAADDSASATSQQKQAAHSCDPWNLRETESAAAAEAHLPHGGETQPPANPASSCPHLYPEQELVVEPEREDDGDGDAEKMKGLIDQYKARVDEEGELDEEELPAEIMQGVEDNISPEQRHFAGFQAHIARSPDQVLRYCWQDCAQPLCPSPGPLPLPSEIPPCGRCGAARRFEFQVLPTLLNYLSLDEMDPAALNWGTIAVYTCSKSCSLASCASAASAATASTGAATASGAAPADCEMSPAAAAPSLLAAGGLDPASHGKAVDGEAAASSDLHQGPGTAGDRLVAYAEEFVWVQLLQ